VTATHTLGTIVLAFGILWVLYIGVVIVGVAVFTAAGSSLMDFVECHFTLGFYCPSPSVVFPSLQGLVTDFTLPVAVVLSGFVLRAASPGRAK
jgi:hypothetical protein